MKSQMSQKVCLAWNSDPEITADTGLPGRLVLGGQILAITVDNRGWLLKNSLTSISQKLLRVRKLYKRFSPVSWTLLITRFLTFFGKTDFFNSHRGLSPSVSELRNPFNNVPLGLGWFCLSRG
jgi:hypothetical protein